MSRSKQVPVNEEKKLSVRGYVRRACELPVAEHFIKFCVGVYILIVFTQLVIDDAAFRAQYGESIAILHVLRIIDFTILGIFILEVYIKIFGYGFAGYFKKSYLLAFDAFILHLSAVLLTVEYIELASDHDVLKRWGRVRGLLRLLRILIVFRKADETLLVTKNELISPAERLIAVLKRCHSMKAVHYVLRQEISTSLVIVSSNNLFEPVQGHLDHSPETSPAGVNMEAAAWISNATRHSHRQESDPALRKNPRRSTMSRMSRMSDIPVDTDDLFLAFTARHSASRRQSILDDDQDSFDMQGCLQSRLNAFFITYTWTFNIWDAKAKIPRRLTRVLGDMVFAQPSPNVPGALASEAVLIDVVGISTPKWQAYVEAVDKNYYDNSYHNSLHAADVLQTATALSIGEGKVAFLSQMTRTETFATLLGALVHDVRHPGVTNAYLTHSQHELALRYNDASVLENFHASTAFSIASSSPECDIWSEMPTDVFQSIRGIVISTVLATDLTRHFTDLARFKSRTVAKDFLIGQQGDDCDEDRQIFMDMVVHSSDMATPTKSLDVYLRWAERVLTEFFCQGDMEKEKGYPVSQFMDRNTTNIAKCQVGFIGMLVEPLFDAMEQNFKSIDSMSKQNLTRNKEFWQERVDLMEREMVAGTQVMPTATSSPTEGPHDDLEAGTRSGLTCDKKLSASRKFVEYNLSDLAYKLFIDAASDDL